MKILTEQCGRHETLLYGEDGKLGLAQKFNIWWGFNTWLLMLLSGALGSVITILISKALHK